MNIQYLSLPNLDPKRFERVRKNVHLYSKSLDKERYFHLSASSQDEFSGTYVSQKNKNITILNENGDEEVLSFVTYDRVRFHLSLKTKVLVIWKYGQSPRKLISKLSELSDFSIVIDPLAFDFGKIKSWLQETCESVAPIKFTSKKITIEDYGAIRMELTPNTFSSYTSMLMSMNFDDLNVCEVSYAVKYLGEAGKIKFSDSGKVVISGFTSIFDKLITQACSLGA